MFDPPTPMNEEPCAHPCKLLGYRNKTWLTDDLRNEDLLDFEENKLSLLLDEYVIDLRFDDDVINTLRFDDVIALLMGRLPP